MTVRLGKKKHPTLLTAFEIVSHDVDVSGPFLIPKEFSAGLQRMEETLSKLAPETLEAFCIGEQKEQEKIIKAHPLLAEVADLINAHFGF